MNPIENLLPGGNLGSLNRLTNMLDTRDFTKEPMELLKILQRSLDSANDAVGVMDPTGRIIYVNPPFLKMWGYEHKSEVQERYASDFWMAEDDAPPFVDKLYEKERWKGERRAERKDGTIFSVLISANTVVDESGNPSYLIASFRDLKEPDRNAKTITAMSEITRAINSTKKLSELFQLIQQSLGKILDIRNFFIALFEKETNTISFPYYCDEVDTNFRSIPFDDKKSITAEVIRSQRPLLLKEKELIARYSMGEEAPYGTMPKIWLGIPLIVKGEILGAVGLQSYDDPDFYTDEDISLVESISEQIALAIDHKRTEEALRASEEKYRNILDSIQDGYYELDAKGRFVFFNRALTRIFGCPEEELAGADIRGFTDDETRFVGREIFSEVMTTGNPVIGFDWRLIQKSGEERRASTSVSLLRDIDGKGIGFQGIIRDITDQRRLEAALQHTQKMEAIGTLAGGIAHNFNNLLMGIQGNISLMLLDMDKEHPFFPRLGTMEKLVQNGSKLTSQLLGYAREGRYQITPVNVNRLIVETSEPFGMTKKEIRIHHELTDNLHGVMADSSQLEQILLNLFINAADAMPRGGDLYLATANASHRDMEARDYRPKPGAYVMLSVRDTGEGMGEKTLERVFDPFFTTKGPSRGTGLGLASVYGIVKSHGGYIDVRSKKGAGSTFNIFLPAFEEKHTQGDIRHSSKGVDTILLVDDENIILEIGEELLKNIGYHVLVARGGKEALELYSKERNRVDLVILDMIMPDMGGGEVYDRLKEINPDIKVLLSSGYTIDGQATEILERGCDGFIQKPFRIKDLAMKIKEIVEA